MTAPPLIKAGISYSVVYTVKSAPGVGKLILVPDLRLYQDPQISNIFKRKNFNGHTIFTMRRDNFFIFLIQLSINNSDKLGCDSVALQCQESKTTIDKYAEGRGV